MKSSDFKIGEKRKIQFKNNMDYVVEIKEVYKNTVLFEIIKRTGGILCWGVGKHIKLPIETINNNLRGDWVGFDSLPGKSEIENIIKELII